MKCPDRDFTLEFRSMYGVKPSRRWLVRLQFPAGTDDGGELPFSATDWGGAPVAAGTFHFAGGRWRIENGRGAVPCAGFARGMRETAVWLRRRNDTPVPGALTFG